MPSKKELLNLEDFFGSFVTELETKFSSDVEYENILDWMDNGGVDKEAFGIELTPQQRLILAVFYGQELTEDQMSILEYWKLEDRTSYDFDFGPQPRSNLVLEAGRRSGKCARLNSLHFSEEFGMIYGYEILGHLMGIKHDSSLLTEDGIKQIADQNRLTDTAIPFTEKVAIEGKAKTAQSDAMYIKGLSTTKKVTTSCGYSLEATPEHRVKVMTEQGVIDWKYFADIKAGDYVCIHRNTHLFPQSYLLLNDYLPERSEHSAKSRQIHCVQESLDSDWGYLLGLLVANGSWTIVTGLQLTHHTDDAETYSNIMTICLRRLGMEDYIRTKHKSAKGMYTICNAKNLRSLFDNLGFTIESRVNKKSTPWSIRRSPKDVQAAYLSGLFDGDGSVENKGRCITLSTASKTLATETQLLLLNFGIVSRVKEKYVKGNPYYILTLRGQRSVRRFVEEIGFRLERKQQLVLDNLATVTGDGGDTERIPYQTLWLQRIRDSLDTNIGKQPGSRKGRWGDNLSQEVLDKPKLRNYREEYRSIVGNSVKTGTKDLFSSYRLDKLIDFTEQFGADEEALTHFKYLRDCDYFYDPVVSIEDSDAFCVDLSVPGPHEYVCQGMTNHNSLLGSLIINYEFEKLCRMDSPQKHYGLASSTLISMICVAPSAEQVSKTIYGQARAMMYNCPFLKRLIDAGKIQPLEKMIKYDEKLLYIYSGNSKSETQVGGSPILIVLDEGALFENKDGESNALTLWDNLGAGGLPFKEDAKRVIISSAWQEEDALIKLYKNSKESIHWIGFRLVSWQVNPKHASRDNPVIDSMYISNREMAELLFEGIRRPGHNTFFEPDEVKRAFTLMSNLYAHELPISDDKLVRLSVKEVGPFSGYTVMHLDPAVTRDAYALAYGHLEVYNDRACVFIDGILAWTPRDGAKVSILNVQQAIYAIHSQRPLSLVSADQKESQETIQRLYSHGINVDIVNFTNFKQVQMYDCVRKLLHEDRIFFPKNSQWSKVLKQELLRVQFLNGNKIDHPPDGCFVGDTLIPLLDGSITTIADLDGKEALVFSCTKTGSIKPGRAKGRFTKYVNHLLQISLDNGFTIKCTPEHPFMLRTGLYIEAFSLIPGVHELMPFDSSLLFNSFNSLGSTLDQTIKVKSIEHLILDNPIRVYDLEVADWNNFAIKGGVFVHNSKDIADCVASIAWRLAGREFEIHNTPVQSYRRPISGSKDKEGDLPTRRNMEQEHGFQVNRNTFRRELNMSRNRWKSKSFNDIDITSSTDDNFPNVPF